MSKPQKTASLSAFEDKSRGPTELELRAVVGPASQQWAELVGHMVETYPSVVEQWNYSGARFGWSLRLREADRVVLYLIPQHGGFLVGIVLGAKAVAAAENLSLPSSVVSAIAEAPKYAEGKGFRLPVREQADLGPIKELAALKMSR